MFGCSNDAAKANDNIERVPRPQHPVHDLFLLFCSYSFLIYSMVMSSRNEHEHGALSVCDDEGEQEDDRAHVSVQP